MDNREKIITKICDMAIKHFHDGLKPDVFATTAAYAYSTAVATEKNPESADAATVVAAYESAASIVDLTRILACLADAKTRAREEMNSYSMKSNAGSSSPLAPSLRVFEKFTDALALGAVKRDARERYNATFDQGQSTDDRPALSAACAHYSHAYAVARAAFVHATAVAARVPAGDAARAAFKVAVTARLHADFSYQPIEPGFLIQIMCSDTTKIVGVIMLIAGLAALSLACGGMAVASVGAALDSAGFSVASIITGGTAILTTGAGLLSCRLFTNKQWEHDNALSRCAVDMANGCG